MSTDIEKPDISKKINSDNYFSNCYIHLTKIKQIHFVFVLIEILLNIFEELETFLGEYSRKEQTIQTYLNSLYGRNNLSSIYGNYNLTSLYSSYNLTSMYGKTNQNYQSSYSNYYMSYLNQANIKIDFVSAITRSLDNLKGPIKFAIIASFILLFDTLYFILKFKKFKTKLIHISIIVNILELLVFRPLTILLFNVFFKLDTTFFLISCFFIIPHIYLIMSNFLYNHLYFFVPEFIDYPYDAFSSLYDIVLFIIKIFLSISASTTNAGLGKFGFLIIFAMQMFFSFYFVYKLKYHSYLFMRNSFLNRSKVCFFFSKTAIIAIALLFGNSEIKTVLFLIISISVILISMAYMYFIYNPYSHITIKRETPMENIFFYLYILSEKNDFDFVFENKVNEHYEKCGICNICKRYYSYINRNKNTKKAEDEEKEELLKDNKTNNEDKLMDLFDIVYDNKTKYFQLIKKIVLNYKQKGKESLSNNYYYYINLSFLMYSDYQNNINLSLNERILLEVLNRENKAFLDNHEAQILQILLCNEFISLSNKILIQLKDILNSEPNLTKAKKLIDLSLILKKMKNKKYKENLFSHKLENISNSRHLIIICSIVYEEIFNTSLNNSQLPIRDNTQPLEDIFHNNTNKNNKIISLSVDITNKSCKIIRAGKGLYSYINNNLFDLFPLIFKQFQISHFLSVIFDNFEVKSEKNPVHRQNLNKNNSLLSSKITKTNLKVLNNGNNNNNKNKKEYIEMKLILCENNLSKMYYKLLTLKLLPLFNNDGHHFIIFDGFYNINKSTFITLQDFEENANPKEKIIGVSEPDLEKNNETYSIPFKKYVSWQNSQGFEVTKISTFNISVKVYNIYAINKKEKAGNKKNKEMKRMDKPRQSRVEDDEEEEQNSFDKKNSNKMEKIAYLEDNASVSSQQAGSTFSTGISNIGGRNKKKDNIYEYGGFNKIKKINFLALFIAIVLLIIEYILLETLQNQSYNNSISLLQYREFCKLYFQLFSSILSISCIEYKGTCIRIIDYFDKQFNIEEINKFYLLQNSVLAKDMMEKRNYLVNIHKCIGNQKYNELFGKKIKYLRISQSIKNNSLQLNLTNITMEFSEAILVMCNSFKLLAQPTEENKIMILGEEKNPFLHINQLIQERPTKDYLSDYEKEFYEMILNYKNYYREFNLINNEIDAIITNKSIFIKVFVYIYLTLDTSMLLFIGSLMYLYCISFESILIKIINFINMTMNLKNDDFSFNTSFSKKIDNLQTILQFYNADPIKAVQELNKIYNDYQQSITSKNKNNANDMNKKNYKKIIEEDKKNELDNVPKNQRIINRKDVKSLGITFIFILVFYINIICMLGFYVMLIIVWTHYFSIKTQIFTLINKNCQLETGIYRALNGYDLMLFHSITLENLPSIVILDEKLKKDTFSFFKSFYEDLKLAFNSKKEKNSLVGLYEDFEDISEFTCDNLYTNNIDYIQKLEEENKIYNLPNITKNLIAICEYSRISETKELRTAYETHFQLIRNGILAIKNSSFTGTIENIINNYYLTNVSVFFNYIIIFLLEITNTLPHQNIIEALISRLRFIIIVSHIIYLLYDIVAIIFVFFFFISGINSLCNRIFILKKIFKVYEIHE